MTELAKTLGSMIKSGREKEDRNGEGIVRRLTGGGGGVMESWEDALRACVEGGGKKKKEKRTGVEREWEKRLWEGDKGERIEGVRRGRIRVQEVYC